jgi:hypothetical protein
MPLEHLYRDEYKVLKKLYGDIKVQESIRRLNIIHRYTEKIWNEYIDNIPGKRIKYLLIAEAPPWSASGDPQYFLDPKSNSRTLMRAFRNALFPNIVNKDSSHIINKFADAGLLLIDSLPFSMNYGGKRNCKSYKELINLCVKSYMLNKLNNGGLMFAGNIKISFGYEANALAVIKALDGKIRLSGNNYFIDKSLICTNGAHYPDAKKIRSIFCLDAV